jgi:hypothetical protein
MKVGTEVELEPAEHWDSRINLALMMGLKVTGEISNKFEYEDETVLFIDHMSVGGDAVPCVAWVIEPNAQNCLNVIGEKTF